MPESNNLHKKPIRSRTASREAVLCCLYELELAGIDPKDAIKDVLSRAVYSPEAIRFIQSIIVGIDAHLDEIDKHITDFLAPGWGYSRVSVIDRNVLRIACYELFYVDNIPPKVTINEAVRLAKKYGSSESHSFVNGILGRLLQASPKATWDSTQGVEALEEKSDDLGDEDQAMEAEVEIVEEGSKEHEALKRVGPWVLRSDKEEREEDGGTDS